MSGTPRFKIYNAAGEYVAACRDGEDAAMMVAHLGDGARVKLYGRIVWREGSEDFSAGESCDAARDVMRARQVTR